MLYGNQIAARFALLCLVAYVLKAHHVVSWLETGPEMLTDNHV